MLEDNAQTEDESLPTLASLSPSSRFRPPHPEDKPTAAVTPSSSSPPSLDPKAPSPIGTTNTPSLEADPSASPEELEDEAHQQGAFNEETGEINWDCPCLGGMAHGPCGEEFRAAFSCFVYSKEEPKGMDCIENFKGMQECFRRHPEIYGAELDEDEEAQAEAGALGEEGAMAASSLPDDEPGVAAAEGEAIKQKTTMPEAESKPAEEMANAQPIKEGLQANLRQKRSIYDAEDVRGPKPVKDDLQVNSQQKSIYDSEDERGGAPAPESQDTGKQNQLLKDQSRGRSAAHPAAGDEEDSLVPKAAHDASDANRST